VIGDRRGQAIPLQLALTVVALSLLVVFLGVVGASLALERRQASADVAALAGAEALRLGGGTAAARAKGLAVAASNGMGAEVTVPDSAAPMPVRVRVVVREPIKVGAGRLTIAIPARREAEAIVSTPFGLDVDPGPGDYPGPFAWRQGRPMRPDVAEAFDRLLGAARQAGRSLLINSAWRSSAEQARLFAAHPDPRWVARPGRSLHRLGTELDLGPPTAWSWLAANAGSFGFIKRYSWEPWHFGFTRSPGSTSVGWGAGAGSGRRPRARGGSLPAWVPPRFSPMILRASIAHGVSAAVLAAQIRAESDFDPGTVSSAGAKGISQLMPDESRRFGVDPFDPAAAIDAQARLMRELLARFGSVPLALAAYNAGPNAVARCGCIPPYPETRAYVARIVGWLDGRDTGAGPPVRLVA